MVFRIPSLKIAHESDTQKAKNKFLDVISDFVIDWKWPAALLLCDTEKSDIYWEYFHRPCWQRSHLWTFVRSAVKFMEIWKSKMN